MDGVRLGRDLRLADLTSRRALELGVTASLGVDPIYDRTRAARKSRLTV